MATRHLHSRNYHADAGAPHSVRRSKPANLLAARFRAWKERWIFRVGLLRGYLHDGRRYYRAAALGPVGVCVGRPRARQLQAWIVADTHKIEKGMALPQPRPGYGRGIADRLLLEVERYAESFTADRDCRLALGALMRYCDYNEGEGHDCSALRRRLDALVGSVGVEQFQLPSGIRAVRREEIEAAGMLPGIEAFFASRHSIRDFSDRPVSWSAVEQAAQMALQTPSVCNRQSWKTYVYLDREAIRRVLDCQLGNLGFGHTAAGVMVVTSDLRTFFTHAERNQGYIDGGMFAMSLVYGFHALGIGTCCLNWCTELSGEQKLHDIAAIPEHEAVIVLIAFGYLSETLRVTCSTRKPLAEVCVPGKIRESD